MRSVFRPRRHAVRLLRVLFGIIVGTVGTARAATLNGRVVDPHGRPVSDVRIVVSGPIGKVADAATDDRGTFLIDSLDAGDYVVRVVASGLQADPIAVELSSDGKREIDIALRVSAVSESVVVSAAQVDVPLSTAPDSISVVSRGELQARQTENVADALRMAPGLSVVRSGGRGAITSLFPRGGGSNYTLVLIDGMRANSFGGGYDFGHLSTADVEQLEIVRGPQSALFGSDAIGGVINIVTRRGGPARGDAWLEGGNQATFRAAASGAGSVGRWNWGGAAERTRSDGFTGLSPASGERVSNDDDRLTHASGSLAWQRPGGADFLVSGNIGRDERGFPGPFGSDPVHVFPGVDRVSRGINDRRQLGGRLTHPWTSRLRQRVEASYSGISSDFASGFGPSTSGTGTIRRTDPGRRGDQCVGRRVGRRRVRRASAATSAPSSRRPRASRCRSDRTRRRRLLRRGAVSSDASGSSLTGVVRSSTCAATRSMPIRSRAAGLLEQTDQLHQSAHRRQFSCVASMGGRHAASVRAPAPAFVHPTRSRSPSPTTRICDPSAIGASMPASSSISACGASFPRRDDLLQSLHRSARHRRPRAARREPLPQPTTSPTRAPAERELTGRRTGSRPAPLGEGRLYVPRLRDPVGQSPREPRTTAVRRRRSADPAPAPHGLGQSNVSNGQR